MAEPNKNEKVMVQCAFCDGEYQLEEEDKCPICGGPNGEIKAEIARERAKQKLREREEAKKKGEKKNDGPHTWMEL